MARIIINGRATADLELKFSRNGKAFGSLNVADNKRKRGENGGDSDNRAIVAEMVKLRAEKATLL